LEDCFSIAIDAKETETLYTTNDITEYIWQRVGKPDNAVKCISQILFYHIRKELANLLAVDKNRITPNTKLKELGKRNKIRTIWYELESRLELSFPKINRWLFDTWGKIFLSETIGQLTFKVIENNSENLFAEHGLAKSDIYGMVRSIVCDVSGYPKNSVQPNTRIADELGLE
ncbi:MAG: hypothetical protein ACSHXL_07000, partial [Bacteroidota bacterium]